MPQLAAVDKWTLVHLATGAIMGAAGVKRSTAYGLTIVTEILEAIARKRGATFFDETPANVAVDIGSTIAAYELARPRRKRRQ